MDIPCFLLFDTLTKHITAVVTIYSGPFDDLALSNDGGDLATEGRAGRHLLRAREREREKMGKPRHSAKSKRVRERK